MPRSGTASGPTIVVAEHERIAAEDLRRRLEAWGYRVQAIVASGEEAIRAAEAIRPDLLLMDIRLRGTMDGVEAARHIKSRLNIPVIYALSSNDPATLRRAQMSEPIGMIAKPYDDHEMRFTIATALARRAMERQVAEAEERYRRLLGMTADMVLLLQRGRIVNANSAALRALGCTLNDLLRADLLRFIAPEYAPAARVVLEEIENGIPHAGVEVGILSRFGSLLSVSMSGEPCTAGGDRAALIVMTDLTARAAAEAEAARFAEELFDARADADERGFELVQAHRELSALRDALDEEQRAARQTAAKWQDEVLASAATVSSCLAACAENVSSPEALQVVDEVSRAIQALRAAVLPEVSAPVDGSDTRPVPARGTQDSPDLLTIRTPL